MSLNANYQKLEPGDEVRLLEIDGQAFGLDEVLYFHGYNVPHTAAEILAAGGDLDKLPAKSIWWQGREYKAWPCEIEGIESSTTGSDAQPTLRVGEHRRKDIRALSSLRRSGSGAGCHPRHAKTVSRCEELSGRECLS